MYRSLFPLAAVLLLAPPATAQDARVAGGTVLINEFQANPPGADPANETFELITLPGVSWVAGAVHLTSIENDGINGTVDRTSTFAGSADANGLVVVTVPDLENPSYTLVLSSQFTGVIGDDLDADDDGVIDDMSVFGTIYDIVGVSDANGDDATMYSIGLDGTTITASDEPEILFRDPSTGDFYGVGTIGDATSIVGADGADLPASSFDTDPSVGTTFGAVNPVRVGFVTSDVVGWRQLAVPQSGMTLEDMAALNLVSGTGNFTQGTNCQVGDVTNVFISYSSASVGNGFNGYVRPFGNHTFNRGQGLFWYFFGDTPAPGQPTSCSDGTTTSTTQALPVTLPLPMAATTGDFSLTLTGDSDDEGFYFIGNPFETAFDLSGVSSTTVTFQDAFQTWDPESSAYQVMTVDGGNDLTVADADDVSAWQGFWAERNGADTGANVTITFESDAKLPNLDGDAFYARRASTELRIAFEVTNGAVNGSAAMIRFVETGTDGWDRSDLSKIGSLNSVYAQIGPVGVGRDGDIVTKAIESRSAALTGTVEIPLAFITTAEAGTFTLSWPTLALGDGWVATLTDRATGTTVDLASVGSYAFEFAPGDAAERFLIAVASATTSQEVGPSLADVSRVFPNPTAGAARVMVSVPDAQHVSVSVFDAVGRRVAVAFDGEVTTTSPFTVDLSTSGLAQGVYVVRVAGSSFVESRRLVVTR